MRAARRNHSALQADQASALLDSGAKKIYGVGPRIRTFAPAAPTGPTRSVQSCNPATCAGAIKYWAVERFGTITSFC
jgi:hypothetical protein